MAVGKYYTTKEAASELEVSDARIRQMVTAGTIRHATRAGFMLLVPIAEVDRIKKSDRSPGRPRGAQRTISQRAVIARINRQLSERGLVVRKPRGAKQKQDLGNLYIENFRTKAVIRKDVNLVDLERELGERDR